MIARRKALDLRARLCAFVALLATLLLALRVSASEPGAAGACSSASATCEEPLGDGGGGALAPDASSSALVFFWGTGCPHCEEAKPFLDQLRREHPELAVEAVEVRRDEVGRARFIATMRALGAEAVGIPCFVRADRYVVGFRPGESEARVRALLEGGDGGADAEAQEVDVPIVGAVKTRAASLPVLTVTIGLVDGINPCAMWVLVVLLGLLTHVEGARRMALYAGTFVLMSGVVYFLFMIAWAAAFAAMGLSRLVTVALGVALAAMGLVNVKDALWFKGGGVSLVIPAKAKPGLFRRMRAIANAVSTPAALVGIAALAFAVNLVELGCTIGLPAIYTRILVLRGVVGGARLAYLALYNVAYVVPLLVVVAVAIGLKRRLAVTEKVARGLKAVSGVLLTAFGLVFTFAPEWLRWQ